MNITIEEQESRFQESLSQFQNAPPFYKEDKRKRLLSQVDKLCRTKHGMSLLLGFVPSLVRSGIFAGSVWESPRHLVPSLVGGTLLSAYPTSVLETLSELRLLAMKRGELTYEGLSPDWANNFLKEILVSNFLLAFEDFKEPVWKTYPASELNKIRNLFDLLLEHIPVATLKEKMFEELEALIAHRPIVTTKVERILSVVHKELDLSDQDPVDNKLSFFTSALFRDPVAGGAKFTDWTRQQLEEECRQQGESMIRTGLVSIYHLRLLKYLAGHFPDFIPLALDLNPHGMAEFERHQAFVCMLITEMLTPANKQGAYGLARVLQRNLLSRKIVWNAFNRLIRVRIDPEIERIVQTGNLTAYQASSIQLLIGGILCTLGQPLGVRQGNNPTCQSARAISMWSRHAPGKLINLLIDAASTGNVVFRYEGELIESASVAEGVAKQFDFKLDPVSIVLVPLLDKIYLEMMTRASVKYPRIDPHISVNPAFYGHWIQTGFKSVYDPLLQAVKNYESFVKTFYCSFHPEYNGGHHLIYPVPLGIFITNTAATMLGFHAISLLRIEKAPDGSWRAYFFNPNSEGPQNWGQEIRPSVSGQGELAGESSLPVDQFVSRVYAYHFNYLRIEEEELRLPREVVAKVTRLSKESWGRKYTWLPG